MPHDEPKDALLPGAPADPLDLMFRSAAVLAGGASERMSGRDKQFLDVGGEPLAFRILGRLSAVFRDLAVLTNRPEGYRGFPGNLSVFQDLVPGFGPLSGLHAALSRSASPWLYLAACDTPEFDPRWPRLLADAILLEKAAGRRPLAAVAGYGTHLEPFHGFYSRDLIPYIERRIPGEASEARRVSIGSVLDGLPHIRIPEARVRRLFPDWELFRNINTPEEWDLYLRKESRYRAENPGAE